MAEKAKHAFGALERVDEAIAAGKIDAYDILFVKDTNGKPYVGWVDKDGNKVVVDDSAEIAELENQVTELETQMEAKANVSEVEEKINKATLDTVSSANSYTDEKLEAALGEYLAKKYEITNKPNGTLVNYRDKEIRVMCPVGTEFTKQNVGATGNANMYYMGFKAYAPDGAVSFKEDDKAIIEDQTMYYFENNDFAGIDENGRKYSIVWLALASYDEASDTWSYFGASSTAEKYIGWYYSVEWYDANGVMIASDCIRINLSNENCHSSIEPYYVGNMMKEINTKIEEKIAEVESAYEIIEF